MRSEELEVRVRSLEFRVERLAVFVIVKVIVKRVALGVNI